MFSVFARSRAGLNLTPGERAFLKLVQGLLASALVAALPVVAQALSSQGGSIDWLGVGRLALGCIVVAFLLALRKWATAQGDAPIAALAGAAATQVAQTAALSSSVIAELDPTNLADTPDAGPLGASGNGLPLSADGSATAVAAPATVAAPVTAGSGS